jgi:hypothetical protein
MSFGCVNGVSTRHPTPRILRDRGKEGSNLFSVAGSELFQFNHSTTLVSGTSDAVCDTCCTSGHVTCYHVFLSPSLIFINIILRTLH